MKNATKTDSLNGSSSHELLNDMSKRYLPNRNLTKLSFIGIGTTADSYFEAAIEIYQQFLDVSGQSGQIFVAHNESDTRIDQNNTALPTLSQWKKKLLPKTIEAMCEANYKPFEAMLHCGEFHQLDAPILIWPNSLVCRQNKYSRGFYHWCMRCGLCPVIVVFY